MDRSTPLPSIPKTEFEVSSLFQCNYVGTMHAIFRLANVVRPCSAHLEHCRARTFQSWKPGLPEGLQQGLKSWINKTLVGKWQVLPLHGQDIRLHENH